MCSQSEMRKSLLQHGFTYEDKQMIGVYRRDPIVVLAYSAPAPDDNSCAVLYAQGKGHPTKDLYRGSDHDVALLVATMPV